MSTNITHWETIEIKGLRIPWGKLQPNHCTYRDTFTIAVDLNCEDGEMIGKKWMDTPDDPNPMFIVESVKVRGEASAWALHNVLTPLLQQSTGRLDAVITWEHGEWLERLQCVDGVITGTNINVGAVLKELTAAKELIMRLAPPDNNTDPAERVNWLIQANGVGAADVEKFMNNRGTNNE